MPTIFGAYLESVDEWDLDHLYGRDTGDPATIHQTLRLTTDGDGFIIAPFDGTLSVKDPLGGFLDAESPLDHITNLPLPTQIPLYLQLNWATFLQTDQVQARTQDLGTLQAFVFIGIDTSSLAAALDTALDGRTIQGGTFDPKNKDVPPANLRDLTTTHPQVVNMLATGNLTLPVKAGQRIGQAIATPDDPSVRAIEIAAVTNAGLVDPLVTYDRLTDLVDTTARTALNKFGAAGATGWPVVDAQQGASAFLTEVTQHLFPNAPMEVARRDLNLSLTVWRQVRDAQKALYRDKLLALVGQPASGSAATPFEFDTFDWRNAFQLEAVVEFYANFPHPWADGAVPLDPSDPTYQLVDFQNFEGSSVTSSGTTLTFPSDTAQMFTQLTTPGTEEDNVIELPAAQNSSRTTNRFVVTATNAGARTMTLDVAPNLPNDGSSWTLFRRPVITVVDCFGARLSGTAAKVVSPDLIELETGQKKVNQLFDTIYFASDAGSPSHAYRIVQVTRDHPQDAATQYQVVARGKSAASDIHPDFGGGTSRWRIPAGVSWSLEPLGEDLGSSLQNRGWDHLDGMLFIAQDGSVVHQARWSTFTNRNNTARQLQSSVIGNKLYRFSSYRSGKPHINFTFKVTDVDKDDRVQGAFYYFDPIRNTAAPKVTRDTSGKANIRIHYTSSVTAGSGLWSAGCITSPNFASRMRAILIALEQKELVGLNGSRDAGLDRVEPMGILKSLDTYPDIPAADWNDKISGWLWVIRPDELPEDWSFTP